MPEESKAAKDLESLKQRVRDGIESLEESVKKVENLDASIRAEIRARQNAKNKRKAK